MAKSTSKYQRFALLAAIASLALATFLGKSDRTTLRGIDSNIHAAAAMAVTSQGILPKLPIVLPTDATHPGGEIFNDHPFTLFWINGCIMRALGPSAFSARLLTALFSVASVLLVFSLGNLFEGEVFGALAAIFAIFSRDFILTSATMSLDTALVFFILLTFWFWRKQRWWGLAVSAGLGLWIKTPVVLLVYPTALLVEWLEGGLRRHWKPLLLTALGALLLGSLVWILTGILGGWDLVGDYWRRQLWGTAVGGRGGGSFDPGFFLYTVRSGFLPGLPFLLIGVYRVLRSREWRQPGFLVPATGFLVLSSVVTAMRFKLGHYYTPIFPFLALLSSYACADWLEKRMDQFYAAVIAISAVLVATLLVSPIPLGAEGFVALRKFVPFILTYGNCEDGIALVPGGEPVGSAHDSRLFLNFYTGRTVELLECAQLPSRLSQGKLPAWLIIGDENYRRCLGDGERARFSTKILMGNQYLLTHKMDPSRLVDLTPLNLDLKAAVDCHAPPYPHDIWHRYLEVNQVQNHLRN